MHISAFQRTSLLQEITALQLLATVFFSESTLLLSNVSAVRHLLQCKVHHLGSNGENRVSSPLTVGALSKHSPGVVTSLGMQLGPENLTICLCFYEHYLHLHSRTNTQGILENAVPNPIPMSLCAQPSTLFAPPFLHNSFLHFCSATKILEACFMSFNLLFFKKYNSSALQSQHRVHGLQSVSKKYWSLPYSTCMNYCPWHGFPVYKMGIAWACCFSLFTVPLKCLDSKFNQPM